MDEKRRIASDSVRGRGDQAENRLSRYDRVEGIASGAENALGGLSRQRFHGGYRVLCAPDYRPRRAAGAIRPHLNTLK
jgi:hypothetical protein